MYESGENNRKELVVFVSSVFLKCFMLPMLSEVIIKSKLSPLTLLCKCTKVLVLTVLCQHNYFMLCFKRLAKSSWL